MKMVYKYDIKLDSVRDSYFTGKIRCPARSKPLCVIVQDQQSFVWMEVETENSPVDFIYYSIGTGHGQIPPQSKYFASVIHDMYVWHIYLPLMNK